MGLKKPYKRTVRQLIDNSYENNGNGRYVQHPEYANHPDNHLQAFDLLIKDFRQILDYVHPCDTNIDTYSYRIHELLIKTCVEIESNFYAILSENGYSKISNWNMNDYKKVENTHHLSSYEVRIPFWQGDLCVALPFLRHL